MKKLFPALAITALFGFAHNAKADDETLFLVNDQTQQVIEVSQAGEVAPLESEAEVQALAQKISEASVAAPEQASDLNTNLFGIHIGRGGIRVGGGLGPIGGGIRIGRGGIRVGGRAGPVGAGARVGRGGVRAGGHAGRIGAGGGVNRHGVRAGAHVGLVADAAQIESLTTDSFWQNGQWQDDRFVVGDELSALRGSWTPVAIGQ